MDTATKQSILLVEDDTFLRDIFARKLGGTFELLLAQDSETALAQAVEKKPVVVLLDLNLPDGNGFDILKSIRADESLKDTLVIILTNSVLSEDAMKSNELKADDFMTKANFSMDEIIERIQSHLGEKGISVSLEG